MKDSHDSSSTGQEIYRICFKLRESIKNSLEYWTSVKDNNIVDVKERCGKILVELVITGIVEIQ